MFHHRLAIGLGVLAVLGCGSAKVPPAPPEHYRITFESGELSAFNLNMASTPKGIRCMLRNNDPNFTIHSVKIMLKTGYQSRFVEADVDVKPNAAAEFYVRGDGYALTPGSGLVSVEATRYYGGTGASTNDPKAVSLRYGGGLQNSEPVAPTERKAISTQVTPVQQDSAGGALDHPRSGIVKVGQK